MTRFRGTLHVTARKGREADKNQVGRLDKRTGPDAGTTGSDAEGKSAPTRVTSPECDMISEGAPVHPSKPRLPVV